MIKNIVFATDLGPYTSHALVHVEAIARTFDAKVHLVHVVPPISDFARAVVSSYCSELVKSELVRTRNVKGILEAVRDQVFDMLAANNLSDATFLERIGHIVVVPGKPAAVILEEVERLGADLIVIGSHGSDSAAANVLGSVSSKILQLAKVPVFFIPMMQNASETDLPENILSQFQRQ